MLPLDPALSGGTGLEEDHEDGENDDDIPDSLKKVTIEGVHLTQKSSKEDLYGALARMHKRQKDENSRYEQLEAKMDDVKAIKQRMAELEAVGPQSFTGDERKLRKYINPDGTLRVRGGISKLTKRYRPGLVDDVQPVCEWQQALQQDVETYNMVKGFTKGRRHTPVCDARMAETLATAPNFIRSAGQFAEFEKAFVDGAGAGAEWILDAGLPEIARDDRLVGEVASLFRVKPMADQTEILPFMSIGLRPFKHFGATTDDPAQFTSSSLTTADRTLVATGMTTRAQVDIDASEDSIVAALPILREQGILSLRHGEEDCILNGDSNSTHGDTGLAGWDPNGIWGTTGAGGNNDHRRTFLGLRQYALDTAALNADESANENFAGTLNWRSQLKSPLGIGNNIAYIMSTKWFLLKFLAFAEFLTLDKAGPAATIFSADRQSTSGARVVLSEFVSDEMTAAGIYDDSSKVKTAVVTVNTSRWWVTERAGNMVMADRDITRGVDNLVFRNRRGFFNLDSAGTASVYYAFNLSIA